MNPHNRRTLRPAMIQPSSDSESEDRHDLPEGGSPLLCRRHAAIGMPPFVIILDPDLAFLSPGTTGNIQETLLHRRTFNLPLPDRSASIEVLPDDVLLQIFGSYRASSPTHWHRLIHVCRRWRRIVFSSPRSLDLRLYCKHGTPVLKTLDCWPAFPIVVQYRGCPILNPPTPEDEDNIVAALKHSDRVYSISLTVTHSLLKKLGTIEEPFPGLEDLDLDLRFGPPFPGHIRWGTRLRSLRLTEISLAAIPQLLLSSPNLVDLRLHEIHSFSNLSSQSFASALSEMTQLQSLSLSVSPSLLFPFRLHSSLIDIPPFSGERVLPALTRLKLRGNCDSLNSFVAGIDAPRLVDIEIMFTFQPTIDVSPLSQFIDRIEIQKPFRRASILSSECAISMFLTRPRAPTRLELGISCGQSDRQLSSMSQICNHFSQSLLGVRDLRVEATPASSRWDGMNGGRWTELIRSFSGAERLYVAGDFAAGILHAFRPAAGGLTSSALPALTHLYVIGPRSCALRDALRSIITPRRLSEGPVVRRYIYADSRKDKTLLEPIPEDELMRILPTRTRRYCNGCLAEQQELIRHSSHRAPPEEREELCRYCRSPWPLCYHAFRRHHHRPPNVGPSDGHSPDHTSSSIDRTANGLRALSANDIFEHPTEQLHAPLSEGPTTLLHISKSRVNRRPTEPLRGYRRFLPNLRSLATLLNSRLRRRAEAAEPSNYQPLDDWLMVGNDTMV
ncbi:hypothetical protein BJY52DRAFT_199055 [Lactarius psammicola]|nr:hypothetical protein BJY52DRAFT_199055 [Lactarius psammicola]